MSRGRIVIDTNVILSRAITPQGQAAAAFDRAIAEYDLLESEATIAELAAKLRSPKLRRYISEDDARALLDDVRDLSLFADAATATDACRDADDNKFLDLAVSGRALCILTGDKDLTVLREYHGIRILTPAAFLRWQSAVTSEGGTEN